MRALVLALAVLVLVPAAAPAQGVIVRFRMAADAADRATVRADAGVRRGVALPLTGAELVEPRPGVTVAEAVATLEASRAVLYAEPDAPRRALLTPDDPLFRQQWALENTGQVVEGATGLAGADVRATAAWDRTTGSPSVTVAVVDSGVDAAHPDLAPNLLPGADLVEDDATPQDEDGHGTHVAGTIGARGGDGLGIAGVAWRTRLLPLRVLDGQGAGSVSDAIRAYARAAFAGARVVNLSFGGAAPSRAERDAIAALPGLLFVAAAGNEGADLDRAASYPCEYELEHVLCVAATDPRDALAPWSDFGATGVDLAAPGVSVLSTWPGRRHAVLSGTSMAAPHVAGAAALLLAADPTLGPAGLRRALLAGAARRPGLAGRVATGRLDVAAALAALAQTRTEPPAPPPASTGTTAGPPPAAPAPPAPVAAPATPSAPAPPAPGSGADATATGPLPSTAAPLVRRVAVPRRSLAAVVRRGLPVRLALAAPAAVRVEVRRAGRRLAARTVRARAAGARTVTVRLPARARRALRARPRAALTVRVRVTDATGRASTVVRRVRLR